MKLMTWMVSDLYHTQNALVIGTLWHFWLPVAHDTSQCSQGFQPGRFSQVSKPHCLHWGNVANFAKKGGPATKVVMACFYVVLSQIFLHELNLICFLFAEMLASPQNWIRKSANKSIKVEKTAKFWKPFWDNCERHCKTLWKDVPSSQMPSSNHKTMS